MTDTVSEIERLRAELVKSNATIVSLAKRLGAVTARLTVIADQAAAGIEDSGIDCTGLGES